jgi:hypothetical protein
MDLIKMITEYLFEHGYRVSWNKNNIRVYYVKEDENHSRIICEIGPSPSNGDIWGYYYKKLTSITVNNEATYIDEWYDIGNIHDPTFLNKITQKMDMELKIADSYDITEWVNLRNQCQ